VQIRMSGALDHSSAGHVHSGESYLEAAKRELKEELGIADVDLVRIGHGMIASESTDDGTRRSHMFDVFACKAEPGQLQADEVKGVYWADTSEVSADMQKDPKKFTTGFLASLPIFVEWQKTRKV